MARFNILHTNDVHSYIDEYYSLALQMRQLKDENTFYFDAGDFCDFMAPEMMGTSGVFGIELLKMQDCDALCIGNNEGNGGYENLDVFCQSGLPVLSCNLHSNSKKVLHNKKSIIAEKNGIRFLIIGVSPDKTYNDFFDLMGIHADDAENAIQNEIEANKGKYDLCILISHLGIERDRQIAKENQAINIIIGGHSHTWMEKCEKVGNCYIHQAGNFAMGFGYCSFEYENKQLHLLHSEIIMNHHEEDQNRKKIYDQLRTNAINILKQPMYELSDELDHSLMEENTITNLVTDALYDQFECDCALLSSGHFEHGLNSGLVSQWDILTASPSHLNPTKIKLKGSQILEALKMSLDKQYCQSTAKGPGFRGHYNGFLCVSHMKVIVKEKQIDQVMINDQLLEEKRDYVVCTSDFLQRGSSYPPLKSNRDVAYRAEMLRNLLEDVIQNENKIKVAKTNRWIYK